MSLSTAEAPALRPFLPADGPALAQIFRAAIADLTGEDYSEAQQEAWIATADDETLFIERLATALTLIATIERVPVGFISLQDGDHIDMLYVHPGVAHRGIARLLYDAIEKLARARGATQLSVDASDTARPLFERLGFAAKHRQTVALGAEWLGNTRMEKSFGANGRRGQRGQLQ